MQCIQYIHLYFHHNIQIEFGLKYMPPHSLNSRGDIGHIEINLSNLIPHSVLCHSDGSLLCIEVENEMLDFVYLEYRTYDEILQWVYPITQALSVSLFFYFLYFMELWNTMIIIFYMDVLHVRYIIITLPIHENLL